MILGRFLGDHLGSPLVGGGIGVTVKDFGGVVAEKGIRPCASLRAISVKEVGQILSKPNN